ncbi:MAG: hypothetical protein BSOLF_1519 [Candidatus Carbobacillus altaicus]|uniref:Uncharacterized protein n=1 Tax=Candidatus Carbonibacillus altaicus TaxID=2163959 RepID=A0A2R6XZ84_9BACL|nr:MAG: hypothetical protein BSOLF_1519 [Candidatus Carbobacillus altaicus]
MWINFVLTSYFIFLYKVINSNVFVEVKSQTISLVRFGTHQYRFLIRCDVIQFHFEVDILRTDDFSNQVFVITGSFDDFCRYFRRDVFLAELGGQRYRRYAVLHGYACVRQATVCSAEGDNQVVGVNVYLTGYFVFQFSSNNQVVSTVSQNSVTRCIRGQFQIVEVGDCWSFELLTCEINRFPINKDVVCYYRVLSVIIQTGNSQGNRLLVFAQGCSIYCCTFDSEVFFGYSVNCFVEVDLYRGFVNST